MKVPPVRVLGDPVLRQRARRVPDVTDPAFRRRMKRLAAALEAFRARHGFGRAIAAPQLGFSERAVALHLPEFQGIAVNPTITWRSARTLTMWDDCMSFPALMVRLRRHASISVRFTDLEGTRHDWRRMDPARSELLQHETDHLDGRLAVDRASDPRDLALRSAVASGLAAHRPVTYRIPPLGGREPRGRPPHPRTENAAGPGARPPKPRPGRRV